MNVATTSARRKRGARPLPERPPGTEEELRYLLRLLYGAEPTKLADQLLPTIRRIAAQALARERLCRASKGPVPGIDALQKAQAAARALEQAINAIPPPLDTIVAHWLRNDGFQVDALTKIAAALVATESWARESITGSPTGKITMGPPDLVTRVDCDGVDQLLGEAAALFSTFHGDAAVSADPKSAFTEFGEAFWRFATGEESVRNLTRRITRMKAKMAERGAMPA